MHIKDFEIFNCNSRILNPIVLNLWNLKYFDYRSLTRLRIFIIDSVVHFLIVIIITIGDDMTEVRWDNALTSYVWINADFPWALALTTDRNCRVTYTILYIPFSANEIVIDRCSVSYLFRDQLLGASCIDKPD